MSTADHDELGCSTRPGGINKHNKDNDGGMRLKGAKELKETFIMLTTGKVESSRFTGHIVTL